VFLDEVGELPPSVQVKLLRVLEEKKALRVGGLVPVDVDARFVAATNRDLEAEVDAGRFRQDLYFRLNGIALYIPPLRERVEEIPALARTFIARVSEAMNRPPPVLGDDALRALEAHAWPGNVRELKNAVEHAVVLAGDDVIRPEHLPWNAPHARRPRATRSAAPSPPPAAEPALRGDIDALEHRRILDTLAECGGNQTRAAKALGISRGTLASRLERFGLPRPKKG
jgi:DNA-binding NtrC family response regulator